ncbi:MAG: STAS domain-containing protein [Candidatus Eisenbacteria bacterium]|nr:STAS domain-containing protein [Candidatus Eisenbacteria bacterium]
MPLKISPVQDGNIRLSGRFDAAEVEKAKKILWELKGSTRVDLADLEYISSAGIGVVVEAFSRLKAAGHTMTLTNLNRSVRSVFSLTGLDRVLVIE